MEARNVNVYFDCNFNSDKRFYNFYPCFSEKIDIGYFLDQLSEDSTNHFNRIYGISNGERQAEYSVVLTFHNTRNDRNYMVFTDGNMDQEGQVVVYALVYDEEVPEPFVGYADGEEIKDIILVMDSIFINRH